MRSDGPLLLAFDTSAAHCAAALVQDGRIIEERREPMARGQAERLAPMLEEVLASGGRAWGDIDAFAVCTGPGNFTGLRIGAGLARGLAMGLGVPAIGVTLFEVLAAETFGPAVVTLEDRRGGLMLQEFRDGAPDGPARIQEAGNEGPFSPGSLCLGFEAAALAARHGLTAGSDHVTADLGALARIAASRTGATATRPAPFYLRAADAAPPSEPAPVILDEA